MKNLFVTSFTVISLALTGVAMAQSQSSSNTSQSGSAASVYNNSHNPKQAPGAIAPGLTASGACTLVIHKEVGSNVCVTPRARMGFHQPYRLKLGFVNRSTLELDKVDKVWHLIISGYPPAIRRMVINAPDPKRGARTSDILWLGYKDLRKAIKRC